MQDFIVALGLVLVIEGVLWAVFPSLAMRMMQAAAQMPLSNLRTGGLLAMALGVFVVWLARG